MAAMDAPDDIEEVLEAALRLAEVLEASDRHIALQVARRAVENDPEARATFEAFDAVGRRIRESVAAGEQPDHEDRVELERLRYQARTDQHLQELLRAQADYVELLRAVEDTVFRRAPSMGHHLA
jgi:cell fate (sporulation/competence/biofilm development) regulator YlbF (YheA/YmcA/DUF963 family)